MTFGSTTEQRHLCELVRLNIALKNGQQKQFKLFTVPVICEPLSSQPVTLCQDTFDHIMNLDLADPSDGCSQLDVDILIGSDQYWDLATGNTCRGIDGPVAIETGLGWVASGPVPTTRTFEATPHTLMTIHVFKINAAPTRRSRLEELLQSFWELESLGIAKTEKTLYDIFCDTVTSQDGRYMVPLPWRESLRPLPDNYQLSLRRLKGLLHRLRQNPTLLCQYDHVIQNQLSQGVTELAQMQVFVTTYHTMRLSTRIRLHQTTHSVRRFGKDTWITITE